MPSKRAYDTTLATVYRWFELDHFVFGPNTNLTSIAEQVDVERLEWVIEDLDKAFDMTWPVVGDECGRKRYPQLAIPDELTVTQLADIVDAGHWPESWVRRGAFVQHWVIGRAKP